MPDVFLHLMKKDKIKSYKRFTSNLLMFKDESVEKLEKENLTLKNLCKIALLLQNFRGIDTPEEYK